MLYYLYNLKAVLSPLNVFQYITFRSAGAFLTALAVSLASGPGIIRWLRAKRQHKLRQDTPAQHKAKAGTPAMGGLIIFFAMIGAILLWAKLQDRFVILSIITCTVLWFIGFLDDYLKTIEGRKDGLPPYVKMAGQLMLGLFVATYLYMHPSNGAYATHLSVPFSKEVILNIGRLYIPFSILVLVGSSNAVNLADGLDGLAGGTLIISALTYALFAYLAGNAHFAQYLRIIEVPGAGELTVVMASMVGACLGFLWYNAYPAEIFMGDTGSLFLGGMIGLIALCSKQELLLVLVGGVFVAEALSVLIQVYSFRVHKKRVFKMAPLHHHFELMGWPEPKVTIRFWIVGIILALFALSSKTALMKSFRKRRVGVLGAGRSGLAAARLLRRFGAGILLSESAPEAVRVPRGIDVETGGHSDRLLSCDLLIRSPGIPGHLPILEKAAARHIPLWSELELGYQFIPKANVVAITGTNGKTTTTTLVGAVFKNAGRRTWVGGNIGTPLSKLATRITPGSTVVLEVSSYQLEDIDRFRPHISAILNVTPDHLEHHGSMKAYAAAKARIFENQTSRDICVLNADDAWCRTLAKRCPANVFWFSRRRAPAQGVYAQGNRIHLRWGKIRAQWLLEWKLPGAHNIENALAAAAIGIAGGIPWRSIQKTLNRFRGVEHRLELVRELAGVRYINDSKATNVDSTRVALESFPGPLLVIMGGRGKGTPYTGLAPLVASRVRRLLLIGEDAARIRRDLGKTVQSENLKTMKRALQRGRALARPGEVVLLSPACASFDQYQNYEHRGQDFKKLVRALR